MLCKQARGKPLTAIKRGATFNDVKINSLSHVGGGGGRKTATTTPPKTAISIKKRDLECSFTIRCIFPLFQM